MMFRSDITVDIPAVSTPQLCDAATDIEGDQWESENASLPIGSTQTERFRGRDFFGW